MKNTLKITLLILGTLSFGQNYKSTVKWKDSTKSREVYKTTTNDQFKITRVVQETPRPFNAPGTDHLDTDDPFVQTEYTVLKDFFEVFIDKNCTNTVSSEECRRANLVYYQYLPAFTKAKKEIGYKFVPSNEVDNTKEFSTIVDGNTYLTKIKSINKKSNNLWVVKFETMKTLSNNVTESNMNIPGFDSKVKTTVNSENFAGELDLNPQENNILSMKFDYFVNSSQQQDNNQAVDNSKKITVNLKNQL